MKKLILTLICFMYSLSSHAVLKSIDGQETHGGNIILAEFWNYHHQTNAAFYACPSVIANPLVNTWLQQTVQTEIKTQAQVFVGANNDQEVVALNMPKRTPPLILISETKWPTLSSLDKIRIMMHESLPIMGLVDDDYAFSSQLFESYKNCTTPKYSKREMLYTFAICSEVGIARLEGPDIYSLEPSQAMNVAASATCASAMIKLRDYGVSLKSCYESEPHVSLESPLQALIQNYRDHDTRAKKALDVFMSLENSEFTSDCDADFSKTCATLKKKIKNYPKEEPDFSPLAQKIGCSL